MREAILKYAATAKQDGPYWVIDIGVKDKGRIFCLNRACAQILGLPDASYADRV